jgi:hypothetical protein
VCVCVISAIFCVELIPRCRMADVFLNSMILVDMTRNYNRGPKFLKLLN